MNRFLPILLCTISISSQPSIEWQRTLGGSALDFVQEVAIKTNGNYIIGGESDSGYSGDKSEPSRGSRDFWVLELDVLGDIVWQKTIGGNNFERLYSLCSTTDGGLMLGGTSLSDISGEKSENSRGEADYWIVKLDNNHNIKWQRTIGGSNVDILWSIKQTSDGGYILGGESWSDISGEKTQNSRGLLGSVDYWVLKLDIFGNIEWQRTLGGDGIELLRAILQTPDSGYLIGGSSASNANYDKTENSEGFFDYWVIRLDADGNVLWQKTIGGANEDHLEDIGVTNDGNYLLCGWSSSNISGSKTENSRGSADYWILKIDDTGEILWQRTIGGSGYDECNSVIENHDGSILAGGQSDSPISGEKSENDRGISDMLGIETYGKR